MNELIHAIQELTDRIARLEKAAQQPARQAWRPREVADLTGIRYEQVLELIKDGQLGAVMAGRLHIVPDAELQRFLADGIKANATEARRSA